MRARLVIAAVILAALPRHATAQTDHQIVGDVWTELEPGKITRGSGATIYIWPNQPAIKAAVDSACAASTADRVAWLAARTALTDSGAPSYGDARVQRDVSILRTLIQLPHAVAQADSGGHFVLDSVPNGDYWLEAETMLNGELVQWWRKTGVTDWPAFLKRAPHPSGVRLGPLEFHRSQFCTEPEPRMGAGFFADDRLPQSPDHVYSTSEVDQLPRLIANPEPPQFPETLRRTGGFASVTMRFVIDASGHVVPTSIEAASATDPETIATIRNSLMAMRYSPALVHGRPVPIRVSQAFNFQPVP